MNGIEAGFSLLPATPGHICFDKSEFMRDDYKVEQLVSDCRRRVPLEKLREDLEQVFIFFCNSDVNSTLSIFDCWKRPW